MRHNSYLFYMLTLEQKANSLNRQPGDFLASFHRGEHLGQKKGFLQPEVIAVFLALALVLGYQGDECLIIALEQ